MPTPSVRQTPNWHGHVTAVTCAPSHRRLGLAAKLMSALEEISEKKHCFFVDLFVRVSNLVAINMYKALGYTIYRKVVCRYVSSASLHRVRVESCQYLWNYVKSSKKDASECFD